MNYLCAQRTIRYRGNVTSVRVQNIYTNLYLYVPVGRKVIVFKSLIRFIVYSLYYRGNEVTAVLDSVEIPNFYQGNALICCSLTGIL